jgi:hypothetical protein
MNEGKFWCLEAVSDAVLQKGLKALLTKGARTEARIVAHLAEVDARKLHLAMGASSLFDYCLSRLGLSNNEAFHRITAARLARRFPLIFELLERRDVHLTAVCLLRDYLTIENHAELLREVSHKTKTEIEELLAQRFPQSTASSRLRKRPGFEPRSEGRYLLQLNVSAALKHKIELARDLMSHANPSGDLEVVVERALDELNARLQSRRFAQAKSTRSHGSKPQGLEPASARVQGAARAEAHTGGAPSRTTTPCTNLHPPLADSTKLPRFGHSKTEGRRAHVHHDVRRAVVARDGQRCAFVGEDGHRCEARAFLQFHHQRAWALGGADTVENLSLTCRAHNRLLAERELGAERVAQAIGERRTRE